MSAANRRRPRSEVRQSLLHAACTAIAALRQDGVRIGRAITATARKFRTRSVGGGRRLPLSRKTMRRHWDMWNAANRDGAVFRSRYKPGRPKAELDPSLLSLIVAICVQERCTLGHVLRTLPLTASKWTIYRRLPAREIQKLVLSHRRLTKHARDLEQQKAALVERVLGATV
jgi:hypothetical protein